MRREPARVTLEGGLPVRVEWAGRGLRVTRLLDAWRVGNRWWRGEPLSDVYAAELDHRLAVHLEHRADRWWVSFVQD